MTKWFYLVDGHEIGPVDSAALKHLAAAGRLTPKDQVRRQDMTHWHLAQEVKGLFDSTPSPSIPPPHHNGSVVSAAVKQQHPETSGGGKSNGEVTPPQIIVTPSDSNKEEDTEARSARFVIYLAVGVLGLFGCVLVGFVVNAMIGTPPKAEQSATTTSTHQLSATPDANISDQPNTKAAADNPEATASNQNNQSRSKENVTSTGVTASKELEQQSLAETEKFLQLYRQLRAAPQMRLIDYTEMPSVEWRCVVEDSSPAGGVIYAHLPSSTPAEVKLQMSVIDLGGRPPINQNFNDMSSLLQEQQRTKPAELEVTINGKISMILDRAPRNGSANRPEVLLDQCSWKQVPPSMSTHTAAGKRQPDVLAAAKFLADWKRADPRDRTGAFWARGQLRKAGYTDDRTIHWRCVLDEYTSGGHAYAKLVGARPTDPQISIPGYYSLTTIDHSLIDDWESQGPRKPLKLPAREVVVKGTLGLAPLSPVNNLITVKGTDIFAVGQQDKQGVPGQENTQPVIAGAASPPWMADFQKITSRHYTEDGYEGFRFGDSLDSVRSKGGALTEEEPGLFRVENGRSDERRLFFDAGKLRIIEDVFFDSSSKENHIREKFGTPHQNDIFKIETDDENVEHREAYYYFPNAICRVGAVTSDGHESVDVNVIDRKWLSPLVQQNGERVSDALQWLKTNIFDVPPLPQLAAIPDFPNAVRHEASTPTTGDVFRLLFDSNSSTFLTILCGPSNEPGLDKGGIVVVLYFLKLPEINENRALNELKFQLYDIITKITEKNFPPRDNMAHSVRDREGRLVHVKWNSADDILVVISPDKGSITLFKRVK